MKNLSLGKIESYDSFPQLIENEGKELFLVAEVMNKSHLEMDLMKKFHHILVNHEIRWRHAVPEGHPDAILGVWEETFVTDDGRMLAKGKLYGETEAQQAAQNLLRKWESEGKEFGVSSQVWKLMNKSEKVVAILFREASLTPFPRIAECTVYKIFEETEGGVKLSSLINKIEKARVEENPQITVSSHAGGEMPLFIYVNVSPSGIQGQGEEVARAIADVDQAVAALKSAANVSSGGVPGEQGQLGEQAPSPEEFVGNTNGQQDQNLNNQNIENKNIEDEEDPEEEESSEDIMQRKNNQRRKINAYEGSNMADKSAEIKLFEKTIEEKEKQIVDQKASITKNEGTIGELSDKVKEYEISLNEAKEVVDKFDDERKATKEKIKTLTEENEKLSNKNKELVLFPKRYKAAKLALNNSEDEKEIKSFIEKISSFSTEQVDTLIKSFEGLAKRIPQVDPNKPPKSDAVKGDVDTQLNETSDIDIDKLAEEYQGLEFLAKAAPDKYKIEK